MSRRGRPAQISTVALSPSTSGLAPSNACLPPPPAHHSTAVQRYSARQQRVAAMSSAAAAAALPGEVAVAFVTVPSKDLGSKIAAALVERRLAACVNIIPGVESVYWWEGKVNTDAELLLKIKTRKALVPALTAAVVELHPYDTCEVRPSAARCCPAAQTAGGGGGAAGCRGVAGALQGRCARDRRFAPVTACPPRPLPAVRRRRWWRWMWRAAAISICSGCWTAQTRHERVPTHSSRLLLCCLLPVRSDLAQPPCM